MIKPIPFLCWAAPSVRIIAVPKARGWCYLIAPEGRPKVMAYRLDQARATAGRYSRRIIEIGPGRAFRRRAA